MRCLWAGLLLLFGGAGVRAGDEADLAKALALQKVMQKNILQAEPAIACILVSRSERYEQLGQGPDKNHPGKLGTLESKVLANTIETLVLSNEEKKACLKQLDFNDPAYVPRAYGSGVAIDASGLILTNYHVVQDATKIFVRLPGGKHSYADIRAADPRSDLAVLKLLNPSVLPLKTITLGDADKVERGQFILTLSNPFAAGFRDGQPSASWGILSNIRRRAPHPYEEKELVKPFHFYGTLLQTDARMHLGCSGGAMLNLQGEMVGLITSVAAIQGGETPGGFAVPLNAGMRRILDVLKRGEEVDYGFLGIAPEKGTGIAKQGVVVAGVGPGSPADVDGRLFKGDIILAVNNQPVREPDDIFVGIGTHLAGSKIQLLVQRGLEKRVATVTLGKLRVPGTPIFSSFGSRPHVRGVRVDYATLLTHLQDRIPAGVLVSDVQMNTAADRAGLRVGAVVTHVNQQPVLSPSAFYGAMPAFGPVELTLEGASRIHLK